MRIERLASHLSALVVAFSAFGAGCASIPHVAPAGGAPQAVAAVAGVSLIVVDKEWDASPDDLGEYVTPVPVELYNAGPAEVRVSFLDFALVDEANFRYKALNPFVAASASGEADHPAPTERTAAAPYPEEENPRPVLLAGRGAVRVAPPRPGPMAPRVYGPRVYMRPPPVVVRPGFPAPGPVRLGWRAGFGYGGWVGYRPYPYYRPWLGPGFSLYWTDPFLYPPGYATWVVGWGPAWYPRSPTVPQDVVNLGLPEGVLAAGGHVAGYLYFQRTQPSANNLALRWEVHEAREGAILGTADVALVVVK